MAERMIAIASNEYLRIKGAREHNLKNIDISIPKHKLVVITGLSGSGKSSLAFDTIYADGQRRYMESLSSYARQFMGQMKKPDVLSIEGISPAISISQKSTSNNPRSTVGTVTEIYDYLRLLYARIGVPHCPECGREIRRMSIDQMTDLVMEQPEDTRAIIVSPVIRGKKGSHDEVIARARKSGYVRLIADGRQVDLSEGLTLDKGMAHDIDIVVDRLVIKPGIEARLADSLEKALDLSQGMAGVKLADGRQLMLTDRLMCPDCNLSIPEVEPRSFSFNSPVGACPECMGLGYKLEFDEDLMIPDKSLSIDEGAIAVYGWQSSRSKGSFTRAILEALAEEFGFSLDVPFESYPEEIRDILLYGTDRTVKVYYEGRWGSRTYDIAFEGLLKHVERHYNEAFNDEIRAQYEPYMRTITCKACRGQRLRRESLAVTVGGLNIAELTALSINDVQDFFPGLELSEYQHAIVKQVLKELQARIRFLVDVGLDYLTLSRAASTLSGGEMQRIRLATQIGSGLVGVDYILDEPSIGLHQRDNDKLLIALKKMRDLGNSVIVVEHDEDTIRAADYVVDMGPGAGEHGGEVITCGTVDDLMKNPRSVTGAYLSGRLSIPVPTVRRKSDKSLIIYGAMENNLKNIDVAFPLGTFICVTGVSGSGKSTLVNEILYKALAKTLNRARTSPGRHDRLEGFRYLDKVINIDQDPIGRTPRSNPATYIGAFDLIRDLFAATPDARMRGYKKGRFSFNVPGGRCEACKGDGIIKVEMHFMADVYVPCDVCGGRRYNRETLEIRYKGRNIHDVLEMTVEEALPFFENIRSIHRKIQTLYDVGLSYIRLGQPSPTLSGGEAQRVKLAAELCKVSTGKTMYVLDEPTTGLHFADVHKLIDVLHKLVDNGNTVVVIEHNMDVIKTADHIIDLGPEGGDGGGEIIAQGTPEEVAADPRSYTGQYLRKHLKLSRSISN